jgi:hypothetical protein
MKSNQEPQIIDILDNDEITRQRNERFEKSIDYLRNHNLQAMSNEVPDELLDWWVAEWNIDDSNDDKVFEYKDHSIANRTNFFVFSRVFMRLMLERQEEDPDFFIRTKDVDPKAMMHASELIRYVQLSRKANRTIPDFDIFDVEHYDEIMKNLCK